MDHSSTRQVARPSANDEKKHLGNAHFILVKHLTSNYSFLIQHFFTIIFSPNLTTNFSFVAVAAFILPRSDHLPSEKEKDLPIRVAAWDTNV